MPKPKSFTSLTAAKQAIRRAGLLDTAYHIKMQSNTSFTVHIETYNDKDFYTIKDMGFIPVPK